MWRRLRSGLTRRVLEAIEQQAVAAIVLLAQEARDADDGRRADPGRVVDLAIGKVARVEQPRDLPALGETVDLGRGAQIGEQGARFVAAAQGGDHVGERVDSVARVAGAVRDSGTFVTP